MKKPDTKPVQFNAGRYYIGDLIHILDYDTYAEKNKGEGILVNIDDTTSALEFEVDTTSNIICDLDGKIYVVSSDQIGIIPYDYVSLTNKHRHCGQLHVFTDPFTVYRKDDIIYFGNVIFNHPDCIIYY